MTIGRVGSASPSVVRSLGRDGAWRSLAARLLWEQEVAGSNPAAPTITAAALPSAPTC
jgi:hypothetical protein